MSVKFIWEDCYSVGNPKLDEQHKKIFELASRLPEEVDVIETRSLINQLNKYVLDHFSHEEELMQKIDFPLLAEHKLLHEKFISELNAISSQPINTDLSLHRFKMFIFNWLVDHIMYEDNKYFVFSNEQNQTAS